MEEINRFVILARSGWLRLVHKVGCELKAPSLAAEEAWRILRA